MVRPPRPFQEKKKENMDKARENGTYSVAQIMDKAKENGKYRFADPLQFAIVN